MLICGSYGRITHTFHGNDILHRVLPKLIEQVQKHKAVARALWGRLPPQLAFKMAGWLGEIDGVSLARRGLPASTSSISRTSTSTCT